MSKMNFDLIHAHDRIFDADIFTMHGIPHKFWIHHVRKKNMGFDDYAMAWVEKRLVSNPRCRRFISVSNLASEKFLQAYDVDAEKIQVIHPGIDMERFSSLDRGQCHHKIRSLWGIDKTDFVILFVSMNFDIKGLDALMAATAKVKSNDRSQNIKLLIVGKGEERKYRRIAQNLGIGGDVIFAGVHREKLEEIYLASDMFSILSKFDTFGIAVLEAMAASLPVVVSSNVGAKDLVRHGVNGFIIQDSTDTDRISEEIGILLNKEVRTRMGKAAHETALTDTWESVAKKYESIYNELLERI
jgi:UDP-glucose:(heptosyl)LPS alpha-1,3-glucosyltransferase